jgi:NAD(P)-dependent dehydrogenase (short-subunit alcohol dehydrogenase family)
MNATKTALVTGANKGIGLEIVTQLALCGFLVFLAARRREAGSSAVSVIRKHGADVRFVELDVSDRASIRKAADDVASAVDHLDVLVNNAGIYPDEGVSILTVARQDLASTFQTNTFGPIEIVQTFLPLLRRAAAARVINMSSGYGATDGLSPDVPSYCLSKLALNGATIMLADALQADGIAVNAVCPGWVRTDMGGPGAPRSVAQGADTAVWLATEAPRHLTGKFLRDRRVVTW